jgi:hypothetical protein
MVVLVAFGVGGCASGDVVATSSGACSSAVRHDVLPVWARGGFSDPRPRLPYVLGRSRGITAILWADPLFSPPPKDHNNKILWVSRVATDPGSDLRIEAQRMAGTQRVGSAMTRTVMGGPGPSIVDLPSPGCWRLTLRWSGQVDDLDLQYAANR